MLIEPFPFEWSRLWNSLSHVTWIFVYALGLVGVYTVYFATVVSIRLRSLRKVQNDNSLRESLAQFNYQSANRRGPLRLPMLLALAVVLISSSAIYLFFWHSPHAISPPQAITVSVCPGIGFGVHRVTSDAGIRFDAPEKAFTVHAALRDMPPGWLYVVKLKDADAKIVVWRDDDVFRDLKIAYPVFSDQIGQRIIRDATERIFGSGHWGYLQSGERWRYVKFSTGNVVGYEPTLPKQASPLDQVLNSACFSQDEISRK